MRRRRWTVRADAGLSDRLLGVPDKEERSLPLFKVNTRDKIEPGIFCKDNYKIHPRSRNYLC